MCGGVPTLRRISKQNDIQLYLLRKRKWESSEGGTPLWLIAPEITRRFEARGIVARVMGKQRNVLGRLLDRIVSMHG